MHLKGVAEVRFEEFAAAHVESLLRLARLLTGNPHEAEDLVQESLLRAHDRWELVGGARNPAAYMRRLLVNVHRGQRRGRTLDTVAVEAPDRAPLTTMTWEEREALRQALGTLPLRQRTAVVLRFYEDLDVAEIAEWMGLRESSVRSALARALEALRAAEQRDRSQR